jgi:hypothetical protein
MRTFELSFSNKDLEILQAALVEMPFRVAAPLIDKINTQLQHLHDEAIDRIDTPAGGATPPDNPVW